MPRGGHNKIERDDLLASIADLAATVDGTPRLADYRENGEYSAKAIYNEFDSWNAALDELNLDVHHRKNVNRVELDCDGPECSETVRKLPSDLDDSEYHYCSQECHYAHKSERYVGENNPAYNTTTVSCSHCGSGIEKQQWAADRYDNHFCSKPCYADWRRENIRGPDHPQWQEYPTIECELCSKPFTARPARADERRFCSVPCKASWQSEAFAAEGNPLWTGGKKQYMGANWPEQRRACIIRDQARCQHPNCDVTEYEHVLEYGRGLDVHHLTPREDYLTDGTLNWMAANKIGNLVTLCSTHHKLWEHNGPYR